MKALTNSAVQTGGRASSTLLEYAGARGQSGEQGAGDAQLQKGTLNLLFKALALIGPWHVQLSLSIHPYI